MLRFIYNFFFTLVSLSLLVVIYLINSGTEIGTLFGLHISSVDVPAYVSYAIYCAASILLTWISSLLFNKFERHDFPDRNIVCIESADGTFIPTYLAYVFIGLSVNGLVQLLFCYGILAIICYAAQIYLFNPVFYLLRYKFYFVTNSRNKKLLVMTKKEILLSENAMFENLYRVNDYTYVEL